MATETFFKFDFGYVAQHALNFAVIVFAFLFVDLFDTVGTLIGVAQEGNLLNEKGELPRVGRALSLMHSVHVLVLASVHQQ